MEKEEQEMLLLKKRLQEKIEIKPIRISTAIMTGHGAKKDDGLTIPDHRLLRINK